MSRTRAIRFSNEEEQQIEEFLKNNTFLDFSSLARLAILTFIRDPRVTIRPNGTASPKTKKRKTFDQEMRGST